METTLLALAGFLTLAVIALFFAVIELALPAASGSNSSKDRNRSSGKPETCMIFPLLTLVRVTTCSSSGPAPCR